MTNSFAAYVVLVFFAGADNQCRAVENDTLTDFLSQNQEYMDFDANAERERIMGLSQREKDALLTGAIEAIKTQDDAEGREALIEYAAILGCSDGELKEGEKDFLLRLGQEWGIDALSIIIGVRE